jgi:hypothetical protein
MTKHKNVLIKSSTRNKHGKGFTKHILNKETNKLHSKLHKINISEFNKMLFITLPILFPEVDVDMIHGHLNYIKHLLTHRGVEYTLRYLKATHETLEHLQLGLAGIQEHEKVSLGKDTDGWPKWLGSRLKSSCSVHNIQAIRYCATLCSARRLLTVSTKTHLQSITEPPSWEEKISLSTTLLDLPKKDSALFESVRDPEIGSDAEDSESMTKYKVPRLQISLKSSPNGVSYFAFPWDRAAIVRHSLEDKLTAFAETYFSGESEEWIQDRIEPYEDLVDLNRELHVGKISLIHEAGKLKPRVFAIVDSLTQTLLGDFHQDLMSILRKIPEDCTFDQDKVSQVAKEQFQKGIPFYGYADLSNASDRLPAYLYEDVGNYLRTGLGTAWVELFNRPFVLGDSVKNNWDGTTKIPKHIRYQCGQPMGALSSWPFMALVHHVIVWYSFGSRKAARGKYLILGDDIVIFDEKAFEQYIANLRKLGVSYTNNFSVEGFEFAKRVFFRGNEVTGAYTQALWACRNSPELFALEWRNLSSRGYDVGSNLHSTFRSLLKASQKRFEWCNLLMTVPHGTEISLHAMAHFCVHHMGRSFCLLENLGSEDRLEEAVKAFRQGASTLIRQRFQDDLNGAKAALKENLNEFRSQFKTRSGLADKFTQTMSQAMEEVAKDSETKIRYLERDLKLMFLNPSDKSLLRPNLPDLPRRIDFSKRDKQTERMRFRAEHQKLLIQLLRG